MNIEYQELINVILGKKARNDILHQNLHVYVYPQSVIRRIRFHFVRKFKIYGNYNE